MIDCPVYKSKLKYDIEHIDEIKNVTYRCLLKRKLNIPLSDKDKKELEGLTKILGETYKILNDSDECFLEYCHEVYENSLKENKTIVETPEEFLKNISKNIYTGE